MPKRRDLTGQKFGMLTAVEYVGDRKWLCECDCGKTTTVTTSNLISGHTKSCGCQSSRNAKKDYKQYLMDLTGQCFGMLTVIRYIPDIKKWECRCDCGNICYVKQNNLCRPKRGTKSCGCKVNLEKANDSNIVEGTNVGNIRSKTLSPRNKTGVKGVYYSKSQGLYIAIIGFRGKQYYLASSKNIEACIQARKEAEEKIYGEFLEWYEEYRKDNKQPSED